jgi:hypothetical protein
MFSRTVRVVWPVEQGVQDGRAAARQYVPVTLT